MAEHDYVEEVSILREEVREALLQNALLNARIRRTLAATYEGLAGIDGKQHRTISAYLLGDVLPGPDAGS